MRTLWQVYVSFIPTERRVPRREFAFDVLASDGETACLKARAFLHDQFPGEATLGSEGAIAVQR